MTMSTPKRTGRRAAAGGGQMSREIGGFVVTLERQGKRWRIEVFNGEQTWAKIIANPLGRTTLAFLREAGLSRKEIEEYRKWVEDFAEPDKEEMSGSRTPQRKTPAEGEVRQQAAEATSAEDTKKAEEPPKAEEAAKPSPPEAGGAVEPAEPPIEAAKSAGEAPAAGEAVEEQPSEPPPLAAKGQGNCGEEDAQVFTARDLAVVVKQVKDPRGRNKYEVKVKRLADCSIVDIIPETGSPTSREVDRMLRKAGLTPSEIAGFVEWARGLGSKRMLDREEVAATFRKVVESARGALSSRLDSPCLDLLIPKRDKETLVNCRPAECWKSANAAAVVPAAIAEVFGIFDFDSEEAVKAAGDISFDPKRHMHISSGPAVDAVRTPEGKWRTPDGQVLDDVPRKLHVPVYIPEGCREDLKAPGLEVKCRQPINIAGRHPSGAEYQFLDGAPRSHEELPVEEFAASLGAKISGYLSPPECKAPKQVDIDKLTSLFQRIYTAAQAAGYSRHDAIYDLAILGRFACVDKDAIREVVTKVYGVTGDESQTLSQRLTHVERAYRAAKDGGPKLRSPKTIYDRWLEIDREAAEEIIKVLGRSIAELRNLDLSSEGQEGVITREC